MNNIESSILELIDLLKIVEPTLKEGKTMMLMDTSRSKKSSKNKKSIKLVGGIAKKKAKKKALKGTCFYYG